MNPHFHASSVLSVNRYDVHAARVEDADRIRAFAAAEQQRATSAYANTAGEYLELAIAEAAASRENREARALVCSRGDVVLGVVAFGEVSGANGAAKIHFLAVRKDSRRRGLGTRLCDAAIQELRSSGSRLVVVELPARAPDEGCFPLLAHCAFREESRVRDLLADGVDLVILRRELA